MIDPAKLPDEPQDWIPLIPRLAQLTDEPVAGGGAADDDDEENMI